jgi:hypothetical protein
VPVVLYGCETWLLILREECRLRLFKYGVLRRIFWSKCDELTGNWNRLHNEELYDLYFSSNIIEWSKREKRNGETCSMQHVACMGRGDFCTAVWWRNRRKGNHFKDRSLVGRIILKWAFKNWNAAVMKYCNAVYIRSEFSWFHKWPNYVSCLQLPVLVLMQRKNKPVQTLTWFLV